MVERAATGATDADATVPEASAAGPANVRRSEASTAPAGRSGSGAVQVLRVLLIGTVLVPLLLAGVGLLLSYRAAVQRAGVALAEAVDAAGENTTKVLDTHVLVADRIADLLSGLNDAQLHDQEHFLHDRIAQQIQGLPQVAAAWVIDASGHEAVSARVYPVDRNLDLSGREDFRALRDTGVKTYISAVRARSLDTGDLQAYFTVSRRLSRNDGGFAGITVVAVAGEYFASFYDALLGGSAQYTATILRDDGTVLARYPEASEAAPMPREDPELAAALARRSSGGVITTEGTLGGGGAIVAYKRLANYPVYVAIWRTRDAVLGEWLAAVAGYAAIGTPAVILLVTLTLVALRRTQREQAALAQARDAIAQRAALEAQLHQAQKLEAVGLLTAGIAHDFNNQLTVIISNIGLLSANLADADLRRQRLIGAALSAADRAAGLTRRLLGFVRSGPVDPRPVNVNEVVASVSDLPWRSLGDQIVAEFQLREGVWLVFVDPIQLENALLNLALNARDAMEGRGTLRFETANRTFDQEYAEAHPGVAAGDYVAVSVSDTGRGMPPEVRERAFEPFFTTKDPGKGTGLGLAQVYGFVTRSGGHCTIDSEPGHGTTVTLFLPRYVEPQEEVGEREGSPALMAPSN